MIEQIQGFDNNILFALQAIQNPVLNYICIALDFIADNGYIFIPVIILMIIFRRSRKIGIAMAMSFVICIGLTLILKGIVARPRPCDLFPYVNLIISRPDPYTSFPSGHTMLTFAPAICLWFQTWKFGLPATVFACCVAASRVYLFAHNPTDVFASAILAAIISLICVLFCKLVFRNCFLPKSDGKYAK